mmetsp:Transcript_26749/g.46106  ORF Transcript_26749/g.46106 Transcript_26749/m.46106 type:complete len:394 (-) Transcript_26749:666-1847(-)|eukprot:CAMPEP_0196653002 /NCGR_PEP_ID=MMETSP1086-20130531/2538_1 /TAXON_ID=77921 /ORGANISM="Cyanoptyche  gloeocystis , Strain SAG4.97" /LENGTH=393 /DNA_ID=CAMNT_0041983919 /DNA_START=97 /DNA_END=1278 /DNA_ORIENTATION=-
MAFVGSATVAATRVSSVFAQASAVCPAEASVACSSRSVAALQKKSVFEGEAVNQRKSFHGSQIVAQRTRSTEASGALTVQNKVGELLEDYLNANCEPDLRRLLMDLADAIRTISFKVRTASCSATQCFNSFGDEQLAVDVLADNLLFDALKRSEVCASGSSEEQSDVISLNPNGKFSVAFDPLDGSSIIDTNFAVGTIFGVWPGKELVGRTGREQVASGLGIYGPRTVLMLSVGLDKGTHEFQLEADGSWLHMKEVYSIGEGKLFAPGNLRATMDNEGYKKLVDYWLDEKYQLRYTGGMVPDVNQIIVKGRGVFANPASAKAPAKLRVLYECAPIALLIEAAGGKSSDGIKSVLDIKNLTTNDRTQVCYGSVTEVKRFDEYVGVKYLPVGAYN